MTALHCSKDTSCAVRAGTMRRIIRVIYPIEPNPVKILLLVKKVLTSTKLYYYDIILGNSYDNFSRKIYDMILSIA